MDKKLPTVNDLSLAIVRAQDAINFLIEELCVRYGVSVESETKEDALKLGLYRTDIKITKINGVKLG